MSSATGHGESIVAEGPPKALQNWWLLDVPKGIKQEIKAEGYTYSYLSPYRPIPYGLKAEDIGTTGAKMFSSPTVGGIFTHGPLALDVVATYELYPFGKATMGQYILDLAEELGTPVELVMERTDMDDPYHVAFLFKNPRGHWQMSYFDKNGPFGHDEGDPVELTYDAWLHGYRRFGRGLLNDMALEFDPELLAQISRKS